MLKQMLLYGTAQIDSVYIKRVRETPLGNIMDRFGKDRQTVY